jgi:hypothetical protein
MQLACVEVVATMDVWQPWCARIDSCTHVDVAVHHLAYVMPAAEGAAQVAQLPPVRAVFV